jgi:hypothetical protein
MPSPPLGKLSLRQGQHGADIRHSKKSFSHYGFSLIESYGAVGVTLESIEDMQDDLIGPECSAKNVQCDVLQRIPHCTNAVLPPTNRSEDTTRSPLKGLVTPLRRRDLKTRVPHGIMDEFLLESDVCFNQTRSCT